MRNTLSCLALGFLGVLVGCDGINGSNGGNGGNGNAGPAGPAGAKGDKGDTGTQGPPGNGTGGVGDSSLSGLTPAAIPGARSAQIEISGVGTHFKANTTTVSFNDVGVIVKSVTVGSTTNVRVNVDLLTSALVGPHDVTVTTPGALTGGLEEKLTLQAGLVVQSTLFSELQTGVTPPSVPAGGITTVMLRNLDYRDNPFDNTNVRPLSGVVNLWGLITPPPTSPIINSTTFASAVIVDAIPPVGGLGMALQTTSPIGQTTAFVSDPADPKAPQVTARTPLTLNAGAGLGNQKIATPNTTALYKYTSPADNYVATLNLSALGVNLQGGAVAAPRVLGHLAPANGHFAEGMPFDTSATVSGLVTARNVPVYLPKMGDYYFVLYTNDLSGSDTHSYTLLLNAAAATAQSIKEPATPDTPSMPLAAIALTKPYYGTDGQIDLADESDYIRIQAGKTGKVYASASTNTGATISVGLYNSDCMSVISAATMLRPAQGSSSQEADLTKDNLYCVRVTGPVKTPYQLVVTQDP